MVIWAKQGTHYRRLVEDPPLNPLEKIQIVKMHTPSKLARPAKPPEYQMHCNDDNVAALQASIFRIEQAYCKSLIHWWQSGTDLRAGINSGIRP